MVEHGGYSALSIVSNAQWVFSAVSCGSRTLYQSDGHVAHVLREPDILMLLTFFRRVVWLIIVERAGDECLVWYWFLEMTLDNGDTSAQQCRFVVAVVSLN